VTTGHAFVDTTRWTLHVSHAQLTSNKYADEHQVKSGLPAPRFEMISVRRATSRSDHVMPSATNQQTMMWSVQRLDCWSGKATVTEKESRQLTLATLVGNSIDTTSSTNTNPLTRFAKHLIRICTRRVCNDVTWRVLIALILVILSYCGKGREVDVDRMENIRVSINIASSNLKVHSRRKRVGPQSKKGEDHRSQG
jgi:hypothetical protein